ncbi:MAG: GNAT family N-acetyltransferase [Rhizobacter sp.]|nr:GNAT family N-acetyltransferase [Rhizobacter sp.]
MTMHFVPLQAEHLPLLHTWLARPHAAQWWQPTPSVDELHADYIAPPAEPNATRAYLAHEGDEPVGFIQSYVVMGSGGGWWEDETDPGARGIDQFLADEARLGQGLGRRMIRAFVGQLFADPAVTVVQTDPAPHNLRAIRCYRAAGFSDVGEVMTPDGPAWLMRWRRLG